MDFTVGTTVRLGLSNAGRAIVSQQEGHYNLEEIKIYLFEKLDHMDEKLSVLLNSHFKTARDGMKAWSQSSEPIEKRFQIKRLEDVSSAAKHAWNTVPDPVDKIRALELLVYADIHLTALSYLEEQKAINWQAGHAEACRLLQSYLTDMPELQSAVDEELLRNRRILFRNKRRRQDLIRAAGDLVVAVKTMTSWKGYELTFEALGLAYQKLPYMPYRIFEGHSSGLACCAVFDNGRKAITGSSDYTLKVWDMQTPQCLQTLKGHSRLVSCCALFGTGRRALSGSWDNTLKVWDIETAQCVQTLSGHSNDVRCCALFDNDRKALSGSRDNTLKVWDIEAAQSISTLEGHSNSVLCCSVFDEDRKALSGSRDNTLKVWNIEKALCIRTFEGHSNSVLCCSVFDNGRKALSGSEDNTLAVWNIETAQLTHRLEGHSGSVLCCTVFDNGRKALSGSWDNTLKVWNIERAQCSQTLEGHSHWVSCCTKYLTAVARL